LGRAAAREVPTSSADLAPSVPGEVVTGLLMVVEGLLREER
jgi:hypothetical protein